MIAVAEEQGFVNWIAQARVWLGWSMARTGSVDAGLDSMRDGIALWDRTGANLMRPFYFGLLADALVSAGRYKEARTAIDTSFDVMAQSGEFWTRPLSEILKICIAHAQDELSSADAATALAEIAAAATDRGERLWTVHALRERVLLGPERSKADCVADLESALKRIEHAATYPLLQNAVELTKNQQ